MAKGLLDRLLDDGRRAEAIQSLLNTRFGPHEATIEEVLKSGPDAIVLQGRFRGQPAVFKRFLRGDVAETITRMQEELSFLSRNLHGPLRANALLACLPADGLVVLQKAAGDRVSLILKADDAALRSRVLNLSGQWLATVAPLRSEQRRLGPHRLERQFKGLLLDGLAPQDRQLVQQVINAANGFSRAFVGVKAVHAIAHGDFAPVNLVSDGQTLCAVDIQGATWFPLARIAARFLVAKDLYSSRSTPREWGLDADDLADFAPGSFLPAPEMTTVFPFFIGQQMVRRFVTTYPDRGGHPAAIDRLKGYLNALETACP